MSKNQFICHNSVIFISNSIIFLHYNNTILVNFLMWNFILRTQSLKNNLILLIFIIYLFFSESLHILIKLVEGANLWQTQLVIIDTSYGVNVSVPRDCALVRISSDIHNFVHKTQQWRLLFIRQSGEYLINYDR